MAGALEGARHYDASSVAMVALGVAGPAGGAPANRGSLPDPGAPQSPSEYGLGGWFHGYELPEYLAMVEIVGALSAGAGVGCHRSADPLERL